jgi:hypothetical protein
MKLGIQYNFITSKEEVIKMDMFGSELMKMISLTPMVEIQ